VPYRKESAKKIRQTKQNKTEPKREQTRMNKHKHKQAKINTYFKVFGRGKGCSAVQREKILLFSGG
jgi:hypothetical protein